VQCSALELVPEIEVAAAVEQKKSAGSSAGNVHQAAVAASKNGGEGSDTLT
jgi:hypothetical protein